MAFAKKPEVRVALEAAPSPGVPPMTSTATDIPTYSAARTFTPRRHEARATMSQYLARLPIWTHTPSPYPLVISLPGRDAARMTRNHGITHSKVSDIGLPCMSHRRPSPTLTEPMPIPTRDVCT